MKYGLFAGSKERKVWVWLAIDRDSIKIAGAYAGSRNKEGALGLWNSLHESCKEVFPQSRHFSVRTDNGKTSHIERFNMTLRQRVSRLGRKILSFFKKMKIISEQFGISFIIAMKISLQI